MEEQVCQNSTKMVEEIKSHVVSICKWNRFFAILFIICAAIMFFSSLMMLVGGTYYYNGMEINPAVIAVVYLVMAGCDVPIIVYLLRAAHAADDVLVIENEVQAVADFLTYSKKYWKYSGILSIVVLALTILALPVSIVVSAIALA
ncbi:MAG: hypothetical protein IKN84_00265 [Bacteroidales bacterium]|nr:hypothetical protein [Bacteroidales bacterium]